MGEGEGEGGHLKLKKITQKMLGLKWFKMVRNGDIWKKKCYDLLCPCMTMMEWVPNCQLGQSETNLKIWSKLVKGKVGL